MSNGRLIGLGAILILVVGSIGPWVDAGFVSKGGLEGDGIITLVLAALALLGVMAARERSTWVGGLTGVFGVLGLLVTGYDIIDIESQQGLAGAVASPGWGLILAAVGSLGLLVAGAIIQGER